MVSNKRYITLIEDVTKDHKQQQQNKAEKAKKGIASDTCKNKSEKIILTS